MLTITDPMAADAGLTGPFLAVDQHREISGAQPRWRYSYRMLRDANTALVRG